jgi:glycosyltransferase involved in cell wall biosynthesis
MNIGLIAYSSNTGLGYQTYEFAKHIECSAILVVDLSCFNNMEVHHNRFDELSKNIRITHSIPDQEDIEWLCSKSEVIFLCETPLNYKLFTIAREYKTKTILQYNYEFLNYFRDRNLPPPDLLVSPSLWNIDKVRELDIAPVEFLPVPINLKNIKFREIREVNKFFHITGRPAIHDRNGSVEFLEACILLGDRFEYEIYIQSPKELQTEKNFHEIKATLDRAKSILGDRLFVHFDIENNNDMYLNGDVLVLPRKYGGLCLPMKESLSAGIPIIMTNISPNDKILPSNWLVDTNYCGDLETHSKIPMYETNANELAYKMLEMTKTIGEDNKLAYKIAKEYSWNKLIKRYCEILR